MKLISYSIYSNFRISLVENLGLDFVILKNIFVFVLEPLIIRILV